MSNDAKKGNFKTYILNSFFYSNFGVIKCYKIVFRIKGKKENIGFWIFGSMILIHFPIYVLYFINGINPIQNYIKDEMKKNGYKVKKKHKECSSQIETTEGNLKEDKKVKSKNKNKSKFYKNNFPPKKLVIYPDNEIENKVISSKDSLENKSDILSKDEDIKSDIVNKDEPITIKNTNFIIKNKDIKFNSTYNNNNISYKENKNKELKINQNNTMNSEKLKRYKILKTKKKNNLLSEITNDVMSLGTYDGNIKKRKDKKKNHNFETNSAKEIIDYMKDDKTQTDIKNKNNREFPLILINADNKGCYNPLQSNYILNNYNYNEAIIHDNRTIWRIFFIYLISKDNILNVIFINPPLELKSLRIIILIFTYSCEFALNAFFYLSNNISDNYHYKGTYKLLYSMINNAIISLVSTLVSFIILFFFQSLSQSSNKIKNLFREQEKLLKEKKEYKVKNNIKIEIQNKIKNILKCLKKKIILFIIFEILTMLIFYYYIIAFCHVYKSTQLSWLLDGFISYIISFAIIFGLSIIFSILYKIGIVYKKNILYKICILFYSF